MGVSVRRTSILLSSLAVGLSLSSCGQPTPGHAEHSAGGVALAAGADAEHYSSAQFLADGSRQAAQRQGSGRVTATVGTGGQTVAFSCDFTIAADTREYALDCGYGMPTSGGAVANIRMIVLPSGLFVRTPTAAQDSPGKSWLRVDPTAKDQLATQLVAARNTIRQAVDLAAWLPETATIDRVASDRLDAGASSRYDLTVGLKALAANETDPVLRVRTTRLADRGAPSVHTSVWLDQQNRPARLSTALPTALLHERGLGDTTVRIDFTQWGGDTVVTEPPADQVGNYPNRH